MSFWTKKDQMTHVNKLSQTILIIHYILTRTELIVFSLTKILIVVKNWSSINSIKNSTDLHRNSGHNCISASSGV